MLLAIFVTVIIAPFEWFVLEWLYMRKMRRLHNW